MPKYNELAQEMQGKRVKTPLGMILENLGYPEERVVGILSNPYGGILSGQRSGQFYTNPGAEEQTSSMNNILGFVGRLISGLAPYNTTPHDMAKAMVQIGPVYHGSPYKFNKFSNEAIGTGEGAQSFGWGHYLSDNPEVAKMYSKDWKGRYLDTVTNKIVSSRDLPVEQMKIFNERYKPMSEQLYEATLHKGKTGEVYLEWDKPLTYIENSVAREKLINVFKERGFDEWQIKSMIDRKITGEQAYKYISSVIGEKEASSMMQRAGISGIKYPTGSLSGIKNTGKSNYVVFNPEDITIESVR